MPDANVCAVCGDSTDPGASSECNWCGRRFHLNQRNDVDAKDCGKVWIDEQYMALQFACDLCLAEQEHGQPSPRSDAPPRRLRARLPARRRRYRRRE
jgi:hypothetical protein